MSHIVSVPTVAFALVLVGASPSAWAQPAREAPIVRSPVGLRFDGWLGAATGQVDVALLGGALHVTWRFLQVGGFVDLGMSLGGGYSSLGGTAGLCLHTSRTGARVRFDVLFAAGAHNYSGQGGGNLNLFSDSSSSGGSATLGFVGGRLGVAYESGSRLRFTLGAAFFYEADLGHAVGVRTETHRIWFSNELSTSSQQVTIGDRQIGGVLTVGFVFDTFTR